MNTPIILASASEIRLQLLTAAGLQISAQPARIDEVAVRAGLAAENATPRDVADSLAEMKARKIADKNPTALVLGCDQILVLKDRIFSKPDTASDARAQLLALRGQTHLLISAIVLYDHAKPVWRHVSEARLCMRYISEQYIDAYLARNWHSVRHAVGAYKLEEEGIRLFSTLEGDYFAILGLPILPLIGYLAQRGMIDT